MYGEQNNGAAVAVVVVLLQKKTLHISDKIQLKTTYK